MGNANAAVSPSSSVAVSVYVHTDASARGVPDSPRVSAANVSPAGNTGVRA